MKNLLAVVVLAVVVLSSCSKDNIDEYIEQNPEIAQAQLDSIAEDVADRLLGMRRIEFTIHSQASDIDNTNWSQEDHEAYSSLQDSLSIKDYNIVTEGTMVLEKNSSRYLTIVVDLEEGQSIEVSYRVNKVDENFPRFIVESYIEVGVDGIDAAGVVFSEETIQEAVDYFDTLGEQVW